MKKKILLLILLANCTEKTYLTEANQCPVVEPEIIEIVNINESFTTVQKNQCKKLTENIYIENVNGIEFDVYYNNLCEDSLGEYCNNVKPSIKGLIAGKTENCIIENLELTGEKQSNGSFKIRILEFK